eukprot:92174_1
MRRGMHWMIDIHPCTHNGSVAHPMKSPKEEEAPPQEEEAPPKKKSTTTKEEEPQLSERKDHQNHPKQKLPIVFMMCLCLCLFADLVVSNANLRYFNTRSD